MRVTEDELILAAHYGFGRRLNEVVAATLTYQRDRRAHDRLCDDARETARVLATAERLGARLPSGLDLLGLSRAQAARAEREVVRAAARLRASADEFFECVGGAVPDVLAAMEAHNWALDRPKLLAALRDQAGLSAELP